MLHVESVLRRGFVVVGAHAHRPFGRGIRGRVLSRWKAHRQRVVCRSHQDLGRRDRFCGVLLAGRSLGDGGPAAIQRRRRAGHHREPRPRHGAVLGHRIRQGGAAGRCLGVCLRRGRRAEGAYDQPALPDGQRGHADDLRAAARRRGGGPARGVLQGAAADHLRAVQRRIDLRGVRGWGGVHSARAVSRGLKRNTAGHFVFIHTKSN
ncbi:hypothetical protein T484DRAFT_2556620 [Baffinella frigidus]|nr:hypothetical protein T484DRAFT_2556620 [Cryptophyta sp. CCMP2293]